MVLLLAHPSIPASQSFDMRFKEILLRFLPTRARMALRKMRSRLVLRSYHGSSTSEIFSKIYERRAWGESANPSLPFYSGSGSHDVHTVETYVEAVACFLQSLREKPTVIDVGCGDFNVGSRIREYCSSYLAVDVVPELIEYNREKFAALHVDFQVFDITSERAPAVEVIFIRQVLQHLSNVQIRAAIGNLQESCRYLIVTEHLPAAPGFPVNLDKPAGPDIRGYIGSGVVLSLPPFCVVAKSVQELCRVLDEDGYIVTSVYEFR